ncbi:MAG: Rieske 2Fe-2S domain-containing protein, partial [Rhodobacteraceae bacterium]|nr:Rieske 2Fe-2S domain-containing protein [Paracoccaceae bacterium]
MNQTTVAQFSELQDRAPAYALVGEVDLVVLRIDNDVRVFYGRCQHRGALMADGYVRGNNLVCPLHNWDYRLDTGVSEYANEEKLTRFLAWIDGDSVQVDADEINTWARDNPQPFNRSAYLGLYADTSHGATEEPYTGIIHRLSRNRLKNSHHGDIASMGVPRRDLPDWDHLQILTAQLARPPLLDDVEVGTDVMIGPNAQKPLRIDIPLFISDMSFGALSEPAKRAMAQGAEMAGTGVCSGEGGMMREEQQDNSRYFYELGSGRFGFSWDLLDHVQAFHFKGGQGCKTGTGGHLPGSKVTTRIAEVRGLIPGEDAISPARFPDWTEPSELRAFANEVRDRTGGIPIGYKLSAQHIEQDIDAALIIDVDYI